MGKEKDEGYMGSFVSFNENSGTLQTVMMKPVTAGGWEFRCVFLVKCCAVVRLLSVVKSWERCAVWVDSVDLCSVYYENKRYTEKIFLPSCQTTFYSCPQCSHQAA